MEEDDFISMVAQRLDHADDLNRGVEKIRDDHDHAALAQKILKMDQGLRVIGFGASLGILKAAQQAKQLPLAGRGADVSAHLIVEDNQAGRIALRLGGQVEKRRGKKARVIHLGDFVGGIVHGTAGVEQDGQQRVGLAAIAFQVSAFGAGKDVPIHMAQVVAGAVGAIFGELLAETEFRRTMQAGDEAIDDGLGHEVQPGDPRKNRWIQKTLHIRLPTAAAWTRASGAESGPNRCDRIPRGNSARCDGGGRGSPER